MNQEKTDSKTVNKRIRAVGIVAVIVVAVVLAMVIFIKPEGTESAGKSGVEQVTQADKESLEDGGKVSIIPEDPDTYQASDQSSAKRDDGMDFAAYLSMNSEEQYAFYKTFEDPEDFIKWYNKAKKQYEKIHKVEEIDGDNVIDLGGNQ